MTRVAKIRMAQWILAASLGAAGMALISLMIKGFESAPVNLKKNTGSVAHAIDTPTQRVDLQDIWRTRLEQQDKQLEQRLKALTEQLETQQQSEAGRLEEMQNTYQSIVTSLITRPRPVRLCRQI